MELTRRRLFVWLAALPFVGGFVKVSPRTTDLPGFGNLFVQSGMYTGAVSPAELTQRGIIPGPWNDNDYIVESVETIRCDGYPGDDILMGGEVHDGTDKT
jgi:hypothetical protein